MNSRSFMGEPVARPSRDAEASHVAPSSFALAPDYGIGGILNANLAVAESAPRELCDQDAYWMRRALLSAMAADGRASPNPTVGAAIVKDGVLIATGATERYGQHHAERRAINNVADHSVLRGATLYTTLEPCAHWGKQPPCADLVASSGFARCVTGVRDPDPRVAGAGVDRIRSSGTEVCSGVLRNELLAWHLPYLFQRLSGRPLVSALAVEGPSPRGAELLLGRSDGWDARVGSRQYRTMLKQQCDVVLTDVPALGDPSAFQQGTWRSVVWWDLGDRMARLRVVEARDLAARARDLGAPVSLVCTPNQGNAAQLEACLKAGVTHVVPLTGRNMPSQLAAYAASGELAAVIGEPPMWVLIDGHSELAEALAAGGVLDAVHALGGKVPSEPDISVGWSAPLAGTTETVTKIASSEVAGTVINEYYTQDLSSVLGTTAW